MNQVNIMNVSSEVLSRKEAELWLKKLDGEIREVFPLHESSDGWMKRGLTVEEWNLIEEILNVHDFPCALFKTKSSFSFIISAPSKIRTINQEMLLYVEYHQLTAVARFLGYTADLSSCVNWLSILTHSERNTALLVRHNMQPLKPPLSYAE